MRAALYTRVSTTDKGQDTCSPQKQKSWLCGLLYQAILMMQAAKHRRFHNTVTGGQLVSVVAGRNLVLVGLRNSRT
jgi:hypothetical protein